MHRSAPTRLRCALALGLLLGAPTSHAQLLGRSPAKDIDQGAEVAKLVEREMGLCTLPEAEDYLRQVGQRLVRVVQDPRWQFNFHIVDQADPNAFAIPGGGIYVSRGLLALVTREDELAGVLAHEIAHVTQRHSARQQRKGILPGLLTLPGDVVGRVVGENLGALINAPLESVGAAWLSHYSRSQETESDRIGIKTAAAAGYDPAALASMLQRIEQDLARKTEGPRRFSIFDSHPMTADRLQEIARRSKDLKPASIPPIAAKPDILVRKLDGLWLGINPEAGVIEGDQFRHPSAGFTLTLPAGWTHQNSPEFLISAHPGKEAVLLLGIAPTTADPVTLGTQFVSVMRSKARLEPTSIQTNTLDNSTVFVVTYLARSGRTPTYLHLAWLTMGTNTLQLVGLAPDSHRTTLATAAKSLRPLTAAERRNITGQRLRIVTARSGENLADLGKRTGNAWPADYTALVNGLSTATVLTNSQALKIARVEPASP